jgi:hypothetical protein
MKHTFTIINYDCKIVIVQATGKKIIEETNKEQGMKVKMKRKCIRGTQTKGNNN